MKLVFLTGRDAKPDPTNKLNQGLDDALALLRRLAQTGAVQFEERRNLTDEELADIYLGVTTLARQRAIRTRRIFGSSSSSGFRGFGKGVPALLVYDDDGALVDVYPRGRGIKEISILEFAQELAAEGGR